MHLVSQTALLHPNPFSTREEVEDKASPTPATVEEVVIPAPEVTAFVEPEVVAEEVVEKPKAKRKRRTKAEIEAANAVEVETAE